MKATEIRMQIVKNLGNYESVRLEAVFTIGDEPLTEAFTTARHELEAAFSSVYTSAEIKCNERQILELDSKELQRVCHALKSGRLDYEALKGYYTLTDPVTSYLKAEKLI